MNEQLVQLLLDTNASLIKQNKMLVEEVATYIDECAQLNKQVIYLTNQLYGQSIERNSNIVD